MAWCDFADYLPTCRGVKLVGSHVGLHNSLVYSKVSSVKCVRLTMAKPRQESIKSRDGPRLLRVVELYVKEGRAAARQQ